MGYTSKYAQTELGKSLDKGTSDERDSSRKKSKSLAAKSSDMMKDIKKTGAKHKANQRINRTPNNPNKY